MQQYKFTKEQTLVACDYGRKYYKSVFPHLTVDENNAQSVDSIFHTERKRSLNINYYNGKYLFKDFAGQGYKGDVFSFVAYQHHLDVRKDFGKILQIINETVEKMPPEEVWDDPDPDNEPALHGKGITYHPESTCRILFKQKFADWFKCDQVFDIFNIRLVDTAQFYDDSSKYRELQSNLDTGEVFFSFSDDADDAEVIYNPDNGETHITSNDLATLDTFAFGWREAKQFLTNDCPEANRNLVITDNVLNVLLLRMMDAPVVGWFGRRNFRFLYDDLCERFPKCLIVCDQTWQNRSIESTYVWDFKAESVKYRANPALSDCFLLKECFLDDAKEMALMEEVFGRFIFEDEDVLH